MVDLRVRRPGLDGVLNGSVPSKELTQAVSLLPEHVLFHDQAAVVLLDGRWRNVLDDGVSYLETSATSMALLALADGVAAGCLPRAEFDPAIQAAWRALASVVAQDGSVSAVQGETNIHDTNAQYDPEDTSYRQCAPGLGAVLRAAAAYARYEVAT